MIHVKRFEFNYFSVNTYLLYDKTGEAVLIDCGCMNQREEEELSGFIEENKLTIKRLLCTHLHLDHVFGNAYAAKTYGVEPEAHKADTELLPSAEVQAKSFGLTMKGKSNYSIRYITVGESIRFGESTLTTLHVPGHSPGSLVFYSAESNLVITGDTLFAGSIGRSDLWGGNPDVLVAAIRDKLLNLPEDTVIYPGHGPESSIREEKLSNPYI